MDDSKFHELLGRALTDDAFFATLADEKKQVEALRSMGINPTDEVLGALNRSIGALTSLRAQFGAGTAAA